MSQFTVFLKINLERKVGFDGSRRPTHMCVQPGLGLVKTLGKEQVKMGAEIIPYKIL